MRWDAKCITLLKIPWFLIVFSGVFYFMYQNSSFCMISKFTTNTKINFCILLFNKFCVFGKWNKSLFKILKKIVFVIWSLYVAICKVIDSAEFFLDFWLYLVFHFILYIKLIHFIWFRYLQQIQKLIFLFYFSMNFMFFENEIKVCLKFFKKKLFS